MKNLLLVFVFALTPIGISVASAQCIALAAAFSEAQSHAQCDEKDLPSLPAGWSWNKVYQIDLNDQAQWIWQSWPDGKNLKVCESEFSGPARPCEKETGPYTVGGCGVCRSVNGYIARASCIVTYADGNDCPLDLPCDLDTE